VPHALVLAEIASERRALRSIPRSLDSRWQGRGHRRTVVENYVEWLALIV